MFPYAREVELLFVNQNTFIDILNETAAQTFNPLVKAMRISEMKVDCFLNIPRDIIRDMFKNYIQDEYLLTYLSIDKKPQLIVYLNDVSHLSISCRDLLYQAIQSFRTNLSNAIIKFIQSAILSYNDEDMSAINRYKISVYGIHIASETNNDQLTLIMSNAENRWIFFRSYPNDTISQDDRNEINNHIDCMDVKNTDTLMFISYGNLLDNLIIEIIDTYDNTSTLFATHKLIVTYRSLNKLPYFVKLQNCYNYVVLKVNEVMDLPMYSYIDKQRCKKSLPYDVDSKSCADKLYDRIVKFDEEYNDYRAISILVDLFMDSYDDPTIHIKDKNKLLYDTFHNSINLLINILADYLASKIAREIEKLYDSEQDFGAHKTNMINTFNQYILKRVSFFADTTMDDDIDGNRIMFASRYSQLVATSIKNQDFDQRISNFKCNPSSYLEVLDILKKSNDTITYTNRLALNTFEIGCLSANLNSGDIYIIFIADVKTLSDVTHQYFYSNCTGELPRKLNKIQLSSADLTHRANLDMVIEDANLCKMWNKFVCNIIQYMNLDLSSFTCSMDEYKEYVTSRIKQLHQLGEVIYKEMHPYDTIKFTANRKDSLVELITSINYYNATDDDSMSIQCTKF